VINTEILTASMHGPFLHWPLSHGADRTEGNRVSETDTSPDLLSTAAEDIVEFFSETGCFGNGRIWRRRFPEPKSDKSLAKKGRKGASTLEKSTSTRWVQRGIVCAKFYPDRFAFPKRRRSAAANNLSLGHQWKQWQPVPSTRPSGKNHLLSSEFFFC
jgi:hypothetical protein